MSIGPFASAAWRGDPILLLSVAAAAAAYAAAARPHRTRTAISFTAALGLLTLAVLSPLHVLASDYLLSARMMQHLLLSQLMPPLLLLGLPATMVRRAMRWRSAAAVERQLRRPVVAWTSGIAALWVWHWPPLFDASTVDHVVASVHHLTVVVAGLVFWWPIVSPLTEARVGTPAAVGYLASACLASSVLGMALTFSPDVVYTVYRQPADAYGILPALRAAGLTPQADQQIGGLLMWVPCCLLYVGVIGAVLLRWYGAPVSTARAAGSGVAAIG